MCVLGEHYEEISIVGYKLDPIRVIEGSIQLNRILQMQPARVVNFDPNLQVRRLELCFETIQRHNECGMFMPCNPLLAGEAW